MDAPSDLATDVGELPLSGQGEPKITAAARVLSIDYQSIVEDAVASLSENTSDKREGVYAHARDVVKRHLQLMSLPEPIVEIEELVLDVTIGKVERHWRAREAGEHAIPDDPSERQIEQNATSEAFGSCGKPLTAPRTRLLRPLVIPLGAAMALSTVAATILFGFYADNSKTYRRLANSPVGRWFSSVNAKPAATARRSAGAGNIRTDRGPTRVGPIHAPFAAAPDAPTVTMSTECGSESSPSERAPCTRDAAGGSTDVEPPKSDTEPPWLAGFAALRDSISGQTPAMASDVPSMSAGDVAAGGAAPSGPPEPPAATTSKLADAGLGAAPPDPPTPLIKPVNPKVITLVESGKRAALKGELDRAVHDFGEAIRVDPTYPDSYAERGQTLFKLGEVERAIADYSAALARDPQHGVALRARGMAYLYGGKTDVALADLSKTIELGERDPRRLAPIELFYARRSRSSIYDSKQQYDLEIGDCAALIESYMRDPMLVEALNENYGSAGAANILATIYRQRAKAFIKKSDWERAMADLTEAIPLSADRGYTALIDRSRLHEGLGQRNLAVADAQAALGIRPGSEEARLALDRLGATSKPTPSKRL